MALKLTGEMAMERCPECKGRGHVPQPETQAVRTGYAGIDARGGNVMVPGAGAPIPCPKCNGKKVIPA